MSDAALLTRVEALEHLVQYALGVGTLVHATASGTIDGAGVVTINHQTPNIASIVANIGANTLTVNFVSSFDSDGIYWCVAFIYDPSVGTSPFLPFTQSPTQTVMLGAYPPPGPWNFAFFAVSDSL